MCASGEPASYLRRRAAVTATLPEPLLTRPGTVGQLRRRLLLMSYHFPPGESVGALRWEKLAVLAVERGWGVDVVTLDPGSLPGTDWTRAAGLPPGTRVYGVRSRLHPVERLVQLATRANHGLRRIMEGRHGEPPQDPVPAAGDDLTRAGLVPRRELRWRLTAPRDYLRAFEAWLDFAHEGAWSRAAGRTALRLARPGVHQAIVTSGPPHMVHQAGRLVSRRTGSPHVIDMRDPWSLRATAAASQASPAWFWLARRHERAAVERAALVVTNTDPLRTAMQALYPHARSRIITVLNGCDEESIRGGHSTRFTIAYAGSIYLDRNPTMVFRAAARVIRELRLSPQQLGFEFIGSVDGFGGVPLQVMARDEGVADYVRTRPTLPRRDALAILAEAVMLLSLPQSAPLSIPSKVFEYMQFPAWLLVLAQRDSATELLLRGTAADVVGPHDLSRIADVLRTRYLQFAAGVRPTPVGADGRFSRRAQAGILFDALEGCIAPTIPRA